MRFVKLPTDGEMVRDRGPDSKWRWEWRRLVNIDLKAVTAIQEGSLGAITIWLEGGPQYGLLCGADDLEWLLREWAKVRHDENQ